MIKADAFRGLFRDTIIAMEIQFGNAQALVMLARARHYALTTVNNFSDSLGAVIEEERIYRSWVVKYGKERADLMRASAEAAYPIALWGMQWLDLRADD
jgi:hypothetical protein